MKTTERANRDLNAAKKALDNYKYTNHPTHWPELMEALSAAKSAVLNIELAIEEAKVLNDRPWLPKI